MERLMGGDKLSDRWRTPKWLADALGPFDLDPCSGEGSHIRAARAYRIDHGQDGLALSWTRDGFAEASVFVNPPYSDPGPWCARLAAHQGEWTALVKLDPTTRWWYALMSAKYTEWRPFRRRLKFEPPAGYDGPVMTANFPSALVWNHARIGSNLSKELWL